MTFRQSEPISSKDPIGLYIILTVFMPLVDDSMLFYSLTRFEQLSVSCIEFDLFVTLVSFMLLIRRLYVADKCLVAISRSW